MVNSINSVNGATVTTATQAVSKTEKTDEVAKQEEQAKKTTEKTETDKLTKTEEEKTSANAFDKETLKTKITNYIEKLKKENDYPAVTEQLDSYLALLDLDKFMKTYPNITTDMEFNTIMYNETIKYL